jgi:hypothetical protein
MSDAEPEPGRPDGKRPYEKPAISWEQPLEIRPALVVACGKVAGGDFECALDPSS